MQRTAEPRLRPWVAFLVDLVVLVVFVAVGRRSHHLHSGVEHSFDVLWPFAVGLVVGWLVTRLDRAPLSLVRAAGAWVITVGLGMALRINVQDHVFMLAFTIVATLFVGACMLGWRLVWRIGTAAWARRRSSSKSTSNTASETSTSAPTESVR